MKIKNLYFITIFTLLAAIQAKGQTTQSAMYDAIALMNAKNGVNGIAINRTLVDPVTGQVTITNTTLIPSSAVNIDSVLFLQTIKILARNAGIPADSATLNNVLAAYKDNPFLSNYLQANTKLLKLNDSISSKLFASKLLGSPMVGAGGSVTGVFDNLVNGTADFLIARAGEEISASVFTKLQQFVAQYPEFGILFPQTVKLLKPISVYEYEQALKAMRDALQNDLNTLPAHLPALYSLPKYQLLNQKVPAITLVFTASSLLNELNGSSGIGRALNHLDTASFLQQKNNYSSFISLVCTTSNSLREKLISGDENADYPYFSADEINKATNNNAQNKIQLAQYYLGLLYQQTKNITFYNSTGSYTIGSILQKLDASKYEAFFNTLIKETALLNNFDASLAAIKQHDQSSGQLSGKNIFSTARFEAISQSAGILMQMVQPFATYAAPGTTFSTDYNTIVTYWPSISNDALGTIKAFSVKDYSLGVSNLSSLLSVVSNFIDGVKTNNTNKTALQASYTTVITGKTNQLNLNIKKTQTSIDSLGKLNISVSTLQGTAVIAQQQQLQVQLGQLKAQQQQLSWQNTNAEKVLYDYSQLLSYINLLAAIGETNNSNEVETLLETYALPAGSSRVKKEAAYNIAFNAYVGGFFARTSTAGSGFTNTYGITAPIGFTFSKGFGTAGSLSIFGGVIDLGGVVRYKLDNNGAYDQNVNLAGLVSPSAQLVYGFPWYIPVSIGAGYQWTSPSTASSNTIQLSPHFNVFLAVDIPLFNLLATKPKTSK
jgi:hypothetical protein